MPPSRKRERRWRSALGCSSKPHSATVQPRRSAVTRSCSGLRERACMCTSPQATQDRPSNPATSCRLCSHRLSSGASSSSTPSQQPGPSCATAACTAWAMAGTSPAGSSARCGRTMHSQPSRSRCQGLSASTRYRPLSARARAALMNSQRLPQPFRSRASATTRSGPQANSLPWIRAISQSRAASKARTAPATEHSSVRASAW